MMMTVLTTTGTVLALGVLLLMALSSVLPDLWEVRRHSRKAARRSTS
ncbi:hypothetical protein DFQ14_101480 [Halopolyspora algeriensis]|uniref:Uncharacterized protein n=1 Tax=Halopolyspora algeriensis TaxID=1500506 RepID=A0A368VY67_9ACTN|nr:hypothetical protein [Halopolyspora algeriensis]RCW47136.1 hypothetical protein DFQ14_101480 [Halopolyspora algeriensis]TQM48223.1 hypothetical protein FHU43_3185 [Halopolyspora algeriensis]